MTHKKFSDAASEEARYIIKSIPGILEGRPAVQGITIDGPSSKDLDDAFWLEKDPQGGYQLAISIADAGSFVTPQGTPQLDKEALVRAFTRYYIDSNHPMLPRILSENHLSLLEGQARPTITITIPLDAQFYPGEARIAQTCLSSSKRFSYSEVDAELDQPQHEMAPMLQLVYAIAQRLLQRRRKRGALAIYDIAAGWATTEEGWLRRLEAGERHHAQIITQELMILTNQALALFFARQGIPVLYRNHKASMIAPERFALLQMMETAVAHPELSNPGRVRTTVDLAVERARYAPTVEGHYGLNLAAYIHMTSPLRRYPDLVNQRILHAILQGEPLPTSKTELAATAEHINAEEDKIKEAKKLHFLAEYDKQLRNSLSEVADTTLTNMDAKSFHSIIRMSAEGQVLQPAIEQEILRRMEAQLLQPHDIFTLAFRFQNDGAAWSAVKLAALQDVQKRPYQAVSILTMGYQALKWSEPIYAVTSGEQDRFVASVKVTIEGQPYSSSQHTARQKELARQRASADLLLKIAGIAPSSFPEEPPEEPPIQSDALGRVTNAVSFLNEMKQRGAISSVTYTYESSGPAHDKTFTCFCRVITPLGKTVEESSSGKTKKESAQIAAMKVVTLLYPV